MARFIYPCSQLNTRTVRLRGDQACCAVVEAGTVVEAGAVIEAGAVVGAGAAVEAGPVVVEETVSV